LDNRFVLPANTTVDGSYRIVRVVGTGGFGITYEAEDIRLGTRVALKEYYPFDYGDRDATMSVRPKSERHRTTFEWGRSSFLREARMLAQFRHPSIVRVSRVLEANSTAYMVMDFEEGQSLEVWLQRLGRAPTPVIAGMSPIGGIHTRRYWSVPTSTETRDMGRTRSSAPITGKPVPGGP
jgi:serine/threonine protein kinase